MERFKLSDRFLTVAILFSVGMLHAFIFNFLEYPTNFYTVSLTELMKLSLSITLYVTAIVISSLNYLFAKKCGLKRVLIWGLYFYFIGMIIFFLSSQISHFHTLLSILLHIATIFFGAAFASVVVSLTTYIILEFPKHIGIGITILFAFMNLGAMLSPIFLNIFSGGRYSWALTSIMCLFILVAIWFIRSTFFDPKIPKKMDHHRRGTLIWKEMHIRLVFFIIAIILYGFCENTFNLWSGALLDRLLGVKLGNETVAVFWLFLVIGQILVILPLQLFSLYRVFYILVGIIILSCIFLSFQSKLPGFIAGLAFGGVGCSACYPILLAMLEIEISELSESLEKRMPLLEMSVALMFGGYIAGVGSIGILVEVRKNITELAIRYNYYWAAIAAFVLLLLTYYLSRSSILKIKGKF